MNKENKEEVLRVIEVLSMIADNVEHSKDALSSLLDGDDKCSASTINTLKEGVRDLLTYRVGCI